MPIENEDATEQSFGSLLGIDPQAEQEMQEDYQKFINKGTKLIHSEQTRDSVLEVLNRDNPLESVADVSVYLVQRIDQAARAAGVEVHDIVKLHGAVDLVGQVAEVGAMAGKIPELSQEELQASLAITVEKYLKGEIAGGRIDQAALQSELQKGIQQMPPEAQKELDGQLRLINRTALKSTGKEVQRATQESGLNEVSGVNGAKGGLLDA
jgi:hypothetical protein